jgi:hypothetical protein
LALRHVVVDVRATDRKAQIVLRTGVEWSGVEDSKDDQLVDGSPGMEVIFPPGAATC